MRDVIREETEMKNELIRRKPDERGPSFRMKNKWFVGKGKTHHEKVRSKSVPFIRGNVQPKVQRGVSIYINEL